MLQWLEDQPETNNDDIVLVADAYGGFNYETDHEGIEAHIEGDMWFQLPMEILLQRYNAIMVKANDDLKTSIGRAFEKQDIRQKVLFGASKQYVFHTD